MTLDYTLRVNGTDRAVVGTDPAASLLVVLRERLGLPAAKDACGTGQCGACTVLVDGSPHCACLVLAAAAQGREVTTLEGLVHDPSAAVVQRAFVEAGAVQCGFCTPGLVVQVTALLASSESVRPDDGTIRDALAGNLCRCTGYGRIVDAVRRARGRARGGHTMSARIGDPAPRPDGAAKVSGEFVFANDLRVPAMLHGAILRSPHPHARIRAIDASGALAVPGVHTVVTAADLAPDARSGLVIPDQPVFAAEVVRYAGEPVGAVAADDPQTARAAIARIAVDYEVLEPRLVTEQQRLDGAMTASVDDGLFRHQLVVAGDPGATGAVVVEGTYTVATQDQAFLAPEAALAVPDADGGGVDVIAATQSLHDDRRQIAAALGLPVDRVRCTLAGVGGAFGGREDLSVQIPAALLSLRTGRPVRIVQSRAESFVGHPHRHPATIWMRHHADRRGRLVTIEARIVLDGGAYASTSPAVLFNAVSLAQGPYRCPNAHIEGWALRTNSPPNGAMRGFGAPQVCVAYEAQMDRLAAACGLHPLEVRRRNALVAGDALATGQVLTGVVPVAESIARVEALPLPPPPIDPTSTRGVGYALGMKNLMFSEGHDDFVTARCRLAGGVATLTLATAEIGQGFVTVAQQVARSELGDVEVRLAPADTTIGPAGSSSASRTTWMAGAAIRAVCRDVAERRAAGEAQPIEATAEYHHEPTEVPDDQGQGASHVAFAFAAHRVAVDVDRELGTVRVVQVAAVHDVGTVVDPLGALGQVEGGVAQGVGLALMEELRVEGGVVSTRSFADYLVPTAVDVPDVVVDWIEEPEPASPLGAKGLGELPCVPSTAATVAAIRAATGRALTRVPVRPSDLVP